MSDSLERLYQAVIAAKDLDPAVSRTARLFQRGPAKMAKKLAEEAIEVVIDAVNGKPDAVVRESADLLYNLTVLVGVGRRAARRCVARDGAARASARNCREAAEIGGQNAQGHRRRPGRAATNCRARGPHPAQAPGLRRLPAILPHSRHGQIRRHGGSSRHAETDLRLVYRRRPQALCALDFGSRGVRGKLVLSGAARCHAAADVAGAAAAGLAVRRRLHGRVGRWAACSAMPSARCSTIRSGIG